MSLLTPQRRRRPSRSLRLFVIKFFLALGVYLLVFLLVELGARVATGNLTESFLDREINFRREVGDHAAYDPVLGWVPSAGFSTTRFYGNRKLSITADGLRSNGAPSMQLSGRLILAVGDSFTFGDEVTDHETWPAHLEKLLQRPVLNAGVFAYGIDQMVLRARQLLPRVNPEWLVLSFIPDDIERCEFWKRGAEKPFFRLEDGVLRLENQPVPISGPVGIEPFRHMLSYSWIVHMVKRKTDPNWFQGSGALLRAHLDGTAVATALLCQLADELKVRGTKLLVVAQADEALMRHEQVRANILMDALRQHRVLVLDLLDPLAAMKKSDLARFRSYFTLHMTDSGNRYVAERIATMLQNSETARPLASP